LDLERIHNGYDVVVVVVVVVVGVLVVITFLKY